MIIGEGNRLYPSSATPDDVIRDWPRHPSSAAAADVPVTGPAGGSVPAVSGLPGGGAGRGQLPGRRVAMERPARGTGRPLHRRRHGYR